MPIPVSLTSKRTTTASEAAAARRARTITSPRSVNLSALLSRFSRIWRRRSGSPLADVGHRPDHAHGCTRGVPDHVAAVQHVGIGAVLALEAILSSPRRIIPVQHPLETRGNACTVVRM